MAALVHDLGRPARFVNMLRVVKVTSPMSVGTWILSAYTPLALGAAASAVTRKLPRAGLAATLPAAVLGPAVASYTSVLLADTAVPAWHDAHRELPFVFAGSAVTAAGGLGMLAVRPDDAGQAVRFAVLGAAAELTAKSLLLRRLGPAAEPYQKGRAGTMMEAGEVLTAAGLAGAVLAGRSRAAAALSGAALMAASALTRFGVFEAGRASARDPKYTVGPQRQRLREQGEPATLTAFRPRTQRPRRRARARTRASATTRVEDRGPDGGRGRRPARRSRGRQRLVGRGGGQHHADVVRVQEEAAALQGKQQREGGPDDHHGDDEQDDDRDQGGIRGTRVAQGHRGAGQQHRVLGHAPAPDDGGDAGRGQDPDAAQPGRR